jgi:hypothetical protein
MVPPDPFSDSLHGTSRDSLLAPVLGDVEGGYAELVGQDLPGNPPIIKSCAKRAVEHCRNDWPSDLFRPATRLKGIQVE